MSVIIPTGGRVDYLRHSVASALAQEGVEVEVVVVIDDEAERTEAMLAELGDPRVRSVRTGGRVGPARGRNLGVAEAVTDWVSFLDDDDLWAPEKLRAQVDAAQAAGAAWCYTEAIDIDAGANPLAEDRPPEPARLHEDLLFANLVPAGGSNVLVSRGLFEEIGGFDPTIPSVTDWDLALRLNARGMPARAPGLLVAYRRHTTNMHGADPDGFLAEIDRLQAKHAALGVAPDRVAIVRWLAGAQRRMGNRREAARLYLRGALQQRSPGNLLRAAGAIAGEPAMALGRRTVDRASRPVAQPEWLRAYR